MIGYLSDTEADSGQRTVKKKAKTKTRTEVRGGKVTPARDARKGGGRSSKRKPAADPPRSAVRAPLHSDVQERILAAVRKIPKGKVCTYGDVAEVAGMPRRARLVGTVLRQTSARDLPWFRVINAAGRISFPAGSDAYQRQRRKLEAEGVVFIGGRIDLARCGWPKREEHLDELLWRMD